MNSSNDHLQNWRLQNGNPDAEGADFLGLNLEALRGLANFAEVSEGFTLAVAEVNLAADADVLIRALMQRPECQQVRFEALNFAGIQVKSLLAELVAKLPSLTAAADQQRVLIVRGLETSIGAVHDNPPFLQDLNFIRDALARQVPYPLILVLPKYAVKRMARFARDFWAWASLVLEFRSVRQNVETLRTETLTPSRLFSSDLKPVKEGRLQQLHQLLEEYAPTAQQPDNAQAEIRLDILQELGDAYLSMADVGRAERCFRQMLDLSQISDQQLQKANALLGLGKTMRIHATNRAALEIFEDALSIYRDVGDRLGEANTLKAIGDVQQFLKQSREALANYESALSIYRDVGDRLGEANTLQAIGDVQQFLKQSREALANYESALSIYRDVGARLGEANTLQAIGDVQQFLKQSREALANYESALSIYRDVGDRLGEANILLGCGSLLEDAKEALALFNQAQDIYQQIGDRYSQARNLYLFIAEALLTLNQTEAAVGALQSGVKIFEEIGFEQGRDLALQKIAAIAITPP